MKKVRDTLLLFSAVALLSGCNNSHATKDLEAGIIANGFIGITVITAYNFFRKQKKKPIYITQNATPQKHITEQTQKEKQNVKN